MDPNGVALVTGANRGIGRATALELAARGFDVVAAMRDPGKADGIEEQARESAGRVTVAQMDLNEPDSIRIPEGLRVLVNNAGVETEYRAVEDAPMEQWRQVFETNLFGLVEVTRRAVPVLRASGGGVLCNVTTASLLFAMPFYSIYRASKAAVSALGESLQTEVAPHGIRVLEILPGPIDTDMLRGSDRLPEAADNDAYRSAAELAHAQRQGVDDMVTRPEVAATTIVEAILDDTSPLRVGCDALSQGALEAWRSTSDQELLESFVKSFRG